MKTEMVVEIVPLSEKLGAPVMITFHDQQLPQSSGILVLVDSEFSGRRDIMLPHFFAKV